MPYAMFEQIPVNNYVPSVLTIEEVEHLIKYLEKETKDAQLVPSVETLLSTHIVPLINPEFIKNKQAALESGAAMCLTETKKTLENKTSQLHAILRMEIKDAETLCEKTLRPALKIMIANRDMMDEYHDKCHFFHIELPKILEQVRFFKADTYT
jgi:hypothetical protein